MCIHNVLVFICCLLLTVVTHGVVSACSKHVSIKVYLALCSFFSCVSSCIICICFCFLCLLLGNTCKNRLQEYSLFNKMLAQWKESDPQLLCAELVQPPSCCSVGNQTLGYSIALIFLFSGNHQFLFHNCVSDSLAYTGHDCLNAPPEEWESPAQNFCVLGPEFAYTYILHATDCLVRLVYRMKIKNFRWKQSHRSP